MANNPFLISYMNNIIVPLVNNEYIEYNDTMSSDELTNIGSQYWHNQDYDNMKICLSMAIEKNNTKAMLILGRYYEEVEFNLGELIRLYTLAYENGNKEGSYSLASYYKHINDTPNIIKYLNICIDRFNDEDAIHDLIIYYNRVKDEINSFKYCNILMNKNNLQGHYVYGKSFRLFEKFQEMKIHFNSFLEQITIEQYNDYETQLLHVFKIFLDNEINLPFVQSTIQRLNITTKKLVGHLNFKLNKTKLPNYKKENTTCPVCFDDTELKLFDCLGHHYCESCTIKLISCEYCFCSKKCDH